MFKNIGRKIKGFAKFLFWLTIIGFSIAALVVIVFTVNDRNSALIGILVAIGLIVAGIILGWLQNFLLYGYGELIDSTQKILEELEVKSLTILNTRLHVIDEENKLSKEKEWYKYLLLDPQTSGGLLCSMDKNDADKAIRDLSKLDLESKIIGEILEKKEKGIYVLDK